jgi:hypothetical protein
MTINICIDAFVAAPWPEVLGRQLVVDDAALEARTALVRRCSG